MRQLWLVLVVVGAVAGGWVADAAAGKCKKQCNAEFQDAETQCKQDCIDPDLQAQLESCKATANDVFSACVGGCPSFAGRCTLTRGCVADCRTQQDDVLNDCRRPLQAQRRRELKSCTTLSGCRVAAKIERADCRAGCNTSAAVTAASQNDPCSCVTLTLACIQPFVATCYEECEGKCGRDATALSLCKRGCRNADCKRIQNRCGSVDDEGGGDTDTIYDTCCANCDEACAPLPAGKVSCVSTTTTTSTSTLRITTTTSATTTTTTTLQ